MRISAPVFPVQLREVHAHIAFLSASLEERPKFQSDFGGPDYVIRALRPKYLRLKDPPNLSLGDFVFALCEPMLEHHPDRDQIGELIRQGRWSFLFDANGNLIVAG